MVGVLSFCSLTYLVISIFSAISRGKLIDDPGLAQSLGYGFLWPKVLYRGFKKAWKEI